MCSCKHYTFKPIIFAIPKKMFTYTYTIVDLKPSPGWCLREEACRRPATPAMPAIVHLLAGSPSWSAHWPCSATLLQQYFSANKQCFPLTAFQHKLSLIRISVGKVRSKVLNPISLPPSYVKCPTPCWHPSCQQTHPPQQTRSIKSFVEYATKIITILIVSNIATFVKLKLLDLVVRIVIQYCHKYI